MNQGKLIRLGALFGVGIGLSSAWLLLRTECPTAPGMTAIAIFGIGMSAFGAFRIYWHFREHRA